MKKFKDRDTKKILYILSIGVVILIAFLGGNIAARFGVFIGPNASTYSEVVRNIDYYDDYKPLFEAREVLMKNYNGDIDEEKLVEGSVKGMVLSLQDPYTIYMTEEEYKKYQLSNEGIYIGIGVNIKVENDKVKVISVGEGTPASKAGIQVGDAILKVDGEKVGKNSEKAVSLLKGDEGKEFNLTLEKSNGEITDVNVVIEKIKTESATGQMIENGIGYIRLKDFNEGAGDQFISVLSNLKNDGAKGIIVDLRGNPGGFLTEAEKISSQFIEKGKVITTLIDKNDNKKESISTGGIAQDMNVVLLIDGNTASAAEVLTGALRDYNIAQTVGTKTFGKGVAQATYEMKSTNGAIKITVQKFYTPNGDFIHKVGIAPDYEVKLSEEESKKQYSFDSDPQFKKALQVIKEKLS